MVSVGLGSGPLGGSPGAGLLHIIAYAHLSMKAAFWVLPYMDLSEALLTYPAAVSAEFALDPLLH